MVVLRRSIRATSVPVVRVSSRMAPDTSFVTDVDLTKMSDARRISSMALDDTDALMTASKRHDQQLLSDINARLANAAFNQPISIKRSSNITTSAITKPPLPTHRPAIPLRHQYLVHQHHRDLDLDVDDELTMPSTPVTRSVIRSSSVPPRLPPRQTASRQRVTRIDSHVTSPPEVYRHYYHHDVPLYYGKVIEPHVTEDYSSFSLLPSAHVISAEAPASLSLSPVADLAVRQAHRQLDRIDKEIKYNYGQHNGPHTFSSRTLVAGVHPVVVPRASARVIHAVPPSTYSGSTVVRRTASLSPIRTSGYGHHHHHHHHHYHPATVRAASPSPSDLLLLSSSVSPPPPAPLSSVHRHHHHLAGGALHTATLLPSDLQLRQMEVDLMPKSSMLDAEPLPLPLPLPLTSVYRQRTEPVVLPYRPPSYVKPRTAHVTADVIATPLPPLPSLGKKDAESLYPQPISVRPKLSETRRKVREVLCKVRKDPHYFD